MFADLAEDLVAVYASAVGPEKFVLLLSAKRRRLSFCSVCAVLGLHTRSLQGLQGSAWGRGSIGLPSCKQLVELLGDIVHLHDVLQAQHKLVLFQQLHLHSVHHHSQHLLLRRRS